MLVNKRKNAVSWDVSTSDIHNTFNKQKKNVDYNFESEYQDEKDITSRKHRNEHYIP